MVDRTGGGVTIISFEDFAKAAKETEHVNVMIACIDAGVIIKRLKGLTNAVLYKMFEWYQALRAETEGYVVEIGGTDAQCKELEDNMARLKSLFADELSREYADALSYALRTGDYEKIYRVYMEDLEAHGQKVQYLIPEVVRHFGNKEIAIVDGGAYIGDLLEPLAASGLNVKTWYAFEMDARNYARMKEHLSKAKLPNGMKCVCEKLGLWSCETELPTQGDDTAATLESNKDAHPTGGVAHLIDMDTYFKDKHIDMIKMDIEGAEMEALRGGINVIKRDRPVFAVTVYHKIRHRWEIMDYLNKELQGGYKWYLRHHTMDLEETVLYGVPE